MNQVQRILYLDPVIGKHRRYIRFTVFIVVKNYAWEPFSLVNWHLIHLNLPFLFLSVRSRRDVFEEFAPWGLSGEICLSFVHVEGWDRPTTDNEAIILMVFWWHWERWPICLHEVHSGQFTWLSCLFISILNRIFFGVEHAAPPSDFKRRV